MPDADAVLPTPRPPAEPPAGPATGPPVQQATAPRPGLFFRLTGRDGLDLLLFVLCACAFLWLVQRGAEGLGYNWQWYQVPRSLYLHGDGGLLPGPLLEGLGLTLQLTALSFCGALAVGLATALLRLSGSLAGRVLARAYLEAIRNTPLLIQLFFLYFALAPILNMDAFATAVLSLSLFEGAYVSEILRAGVLSVDSGQWDAAQSLGMGRWTAFRLVILPQALRRTCPPLASQGVSLIKDSSLASAIAIGELTLRGQSIIAETFLSFEIWFTVALLYWLVTTCLSGVASLLEQRLAFPA